MTEAEARKDLYSRGVFRMVPGLWCDHNVPDLIIVHEDHDNALSVRTALVKAGQLPSSTEGEK